jgi:hypothetical protein
VGGLQNSHLAERLEPFEVCAHRASTILESESMVDILALVLSSLVSAGVGLLIQGAWAGNKVAAGVVAALILGLSSQLCLIVFGADVHFNTVLAVGFMPFFVLAAMAIRFR